MNLLFIENIRWAASLLLSKFMNFGTFVKIFRARMS